MSDWTPEEQQVVMSRQAMLRPLPHEGTTRLIPNGWAGVEPLPVTDYKDGFGTVWVVPKTAQRAMKANGYCITVLVVKGPDGQLQMSIQIPEVTLTKDS